MQNMKQQASSVLLVILKATQELFSLAPSGDKPSVERWEHRMGVLAIQVWRAKEQTEIAAQASARGSFNCKGCHTQKAQS